MSSFGTPTQTQWEGFLAMINSSIVQAAARAAADTAEEVTKRLRLEPVLWTDDGGSSATSQSVLRNDDKISKLFEFHKRG